MRPHHFVADGFRDLGEQRLRCARCGMLSHWAGAHDECPWLDAASMARLAAIDAADGRVVEQERRPEPPSIDGRWAGPYRDEPARECVRCGGAYRRPTAMGKVSYCGPVCVREVKRARVAARMRLVYAQKKAGVAP